MRIGFKGYISEYKSLSTLCKKYLNLYMLQSVTAGVGFFIAIYLEIHFKLPPKTIGYIVGCYIAGNFFGSWFTARVLDKYDSFKYSALMLIIQGLSFLAICLISNITLISIIMFILGVSSYAYTITNNYVITVLAGNNEDKRSTAISLLNVFSNIGIGLGGAIVSIFSKNQPILMLSSMGVILMVSALFYLKSEGMDKQSEQKIKGKDNDLVPSVIIYRLSLFIIFGLGLIFAQQRVSYSLFLENSFGESGASTVFLLNSLLIIFLLPSVIKYFKKFNNVFSLGLGGLLLGGAMFFLQYADIFYVVIFICIVATLGEMLASVFSQLLCFQSAPKNGQGKAMGYYKLLYAFGTWIGSNLGGNIQENYGLNGVWEFCGVIGFIVFISCLISYKYIPKRHLVVS